MLKTVRAALLALALFIPSAFAQDALKWHPYALVQTPDHIVRLYADENAEGYADKADCDVRKEQMWAANTAEFPDGKVLVRCSQLTVEQETEFVRKAFGIDDKSI